MLSKRLLIEKCHVKMTTQKTPRNEKKVNICALNKEINFSVIVYSFSFCNFDKVQKTAYSTRRQPRLVIKMKEWGGREILAAVESQTCVE